MKKRATLFCLFLLICTSVFGEEPPDERWVAHYNGPGSGNDEAHALAVDNSGNIYVTGESKGSVSTDFCTIKYSPDSNIPLWVARYNGPNNNSDSAYAIALDSNDNIYVTGQDWGNETFHDYATIKYTSESNEPVWVARYNGPAHDDDSAVAIGIDSNNNIYVTGYSIGSGSTSRDSVTIKYDAKGNKLWTAKYGSGNGSYYYTRAIAIDTQDNIYVTGHLNQGTPNDYFTIKYSANSNQPVWMVRYNGPGNKNDSARAIVTDKNNNVYVTGESEGTNSVNDYTTIKYDADGNEIWVARYNGPGNSDDSAHAIAIDDEDNIYVTGASCASDGTWDYATIKYTPDSNIPVWVARYNGPGNDEDIARAIAVDRDNNIYVTGESIGTGTNYDYATVKYDSNGNEIWVTRYNRTGSFRDDAQAIAVDNENNVYVTGNSYDGGGINADYTTIKYTQHGICLGPVISDLNNDCKVDFVDYAKLAQYWLIEQDWVDMEILTDNWLECNYALEEDCR
jgi:uncharacterized delta-60 repeat protein